MRIGTVPWYAPEPPHSVRRRSLQELSTARPDDDCRGPAPRSSKTSESGTGLSRPLGRTRPAEAEHENALKELLARMLDRQLVRARVIARQAGYIRSLKRQISWRADWDSIARCESTHRWHLNVGIFDGGLQVQSLDVGRLRGTSIRPVRLASHEGRTDGRGNPNPERRGPRRVAVLLPLVLNPP
jgi:hypothetical protein